MKRSNTRKLSDVLAQHRKENKLIDQKLMELSVVNSWEEIMGKTIAKYTQQINIGNGVLYIKLSSPMLKNEFLMMRESLIEHINGFVQFNLINKVVFL